MACTAPHRAHPLLSASSPGPMPRARRAAQGVGQHPRGWKPGCGPQSMACAPQPPLHPCLLPSQCQGWPVASHSRASIQLAPAATLQACAARPVPARGLGSRGSVTASLTSTGYAAFLRGKHCPGETSGDFPKAGVGVSTLTAHHQGEAEPCTHKVEPGLGVASRATGHPRGNTQNRTLMLCKKRRLSE